MKKLKVMVVLLGMCFVFGACGKKEEKGEAGSTSVETGQDAGMEAEKKESIEDKTDHGKEEGYQKDPDLPRTLSMNATVKFCVDTPDSVESHAANGYYVPGDNYFVLYGAYTDPGSQLLYGVDITKISVASDVLEEMSEQLCWTSREGLIRADNYSMEIANKEEITVNGWDMCRYEGKVLLTSEFTLAYDSADFAAYTVIKDGYPVFFAVFDDPKVEEDVDIVAIADKIAKTFREYEED